MNDASRPRTRRERRSLGSGFRRLLTGLGALTLLVVFGALVWALFVQGPEGVPDRTVLELDLERGYIENVPRDFTSRELHGDGPTVLDVVSALERAADDDRVVGLIAKVGNNGMGLGRVQEIRDAVERFRESGKPAVAWAETFGEVGAGNASYYLATAFDEIHLQPSGDVGLTGLRTETSFVRDALDKVNVRIEGDHRYEYKNAFNTFVDTAYTEAHREATSAVMEARFRQMVRGIAEGRGLDTTTVADLFDRGPFLGEEAVEAGLVDGTAYRDEVYDDLFGRFEQEFELLYAPRYLARAGSPHAEGTKVALIYGTGPVMRGESGFEWATWSPSMGSETVTAAFRAAIESDDVEAILFRVSSPGGSYVASDAIWRETVRATGAGKPVVVSMGDVAGSGGYFVAMAADAIVAQPATITGSIGVLNFKPVMDGMWDDLGIDWDAVQTGERADMWSTLEGFDEGERERLQAWLDRVYEDFTSKAADGRGLELDSLQRIARGRIWAGEDARRIGLVDELGGYATALDRIRGELELDADADLDLELYPRPVPVWKQFLEEGPSSSEEEAVSALLRRVGDAGRPAARLARQLGLARAGGVLAMPPWVAVGG
jgi:protease-4